MEQCDYLGVGRAICAKDTASEPNAVSEQRAGGVRSTVVVGAVGRTVVGVLQRNASAFGVENELQRGEDFRLQHVLKLGCAAVAARHQGLDAVGD